MRVKPWYIVAAAAAFSLLISFTFFRLPKASLRNDEWSNPFAQTTYPPVVDATDSKKADLDTAIQDGNEAKVDPSDTIKGTAAPIIPKPRRKIAYATFLSTRVQSPQDHDPYFTAARVLAYQLLHQSSTKTNTSQMGDVPLLILVPPHVSKAKREILSLSGATIVPVEPLTPKTDWASPSEERFEDQFTKLRLWEVEDYDRILYLDSDMLLTRPLDDIWDEQISREPFPSDPKLRASDEAQVPEAYLICGVSDVGGPSHIDTGMLNGGFFMMQPNKQLMEHYVSILNIPDRFDSGLMEQSLLNYAHREDGPMPARFFENSKWNVNWPQLDDLNRGVASLHDKFWDGVEEGNEWRDQELIDMWFNVQGRMEGWWAKQQAKLFPEDPGGWV